MKTKKVLSVLLVAAMTTAMVCGCGSSDSKGDSQTAKAQSQISQEHPSHS